MKGWILVWDLDETLVSGWPNTPIINPTAVKILELADKARTSGRVEAIFLLTNNSDKDYINAAIVQLPPFDNVMDSTHRSRTKLPSIGNYNGNVSKSLSDVVQLFAEIGVSVAKDDIKNRVLFFDNYPDHVIKDEIAKAHYIHITPDFKAGSVKKDLTRWNYVRKLLGASKRVTRKRSDHGKRSNSSKRSDPGKRRERSERSRRNNLHR